jgi:DNA-directed RNA polymerase subunit omega
MSKITVDAEVEMVGGSRFELILIAAERAREIARGSTPRLVTTSKPVSAALEEIGAGLYTKEEYMDKLVKRK